MSKIELPENLFPFDRPLLSVVAIYSGEDEERVSDFMKHLPSFAEWILCRTEQHTAEGIVDQKWGNAVKHCLYTYERFSFSAARNVAMTRATGEWILSLDMDEILPAYCHEDLKTILQEAEEDVLGIRLGVFSSICDHTTNTYMRCASAAVRIFRNHRGIRWQGHCHEMVDWSIGEQKILDTSIHIHHTGYDTDKGVMMKKMARNIALLARDVAELTDEKDAAQRSLKFDYLIKTSHAFYTLQQR